MAGPNWRRTWSRLFKAKALEVGSSEMHVRAGCLPLPSETPEHFLKLALQCLEQVDMLSALRKFNEQQCKYLADKLRLAIQRMSLVTEQTETEFLCLVLHADKGRPLEIFKLLYSMGKQVEDFTQSCCEESWIQSAIMLTNMSERVATIGFNLEFCTIVFSERTIGMRGSLRNFDVAGVRQAEAEIVKEKSTLDETNLIRALNAVTQSSVSSSVECLLASFLLGRLELVRLQAGATLPTANNKCHLQMNLSLKQMGISLGKGASASVHKAKWLGVEVAKKTFYGPKNGDFLQEVSILEGLSHPNIVSLLWYMMDEKRCHLVMELMDGDLHSLMQERMEENGDQSPPFCIPEALDLMLQVGEGMSFLHEKRIVHRDLKSHNILIKYGHATKANMKYLHVKVADFGLSKTKEQSAYSNVTLNVGTTRWMAPEVMKIANDDDQARKVELKYPFKSDVYSFAMVCYEILTGDVPFSALSLISEVRSLVLGGGRPQLPHECPDRLRTLIKACWSAEAVTRPGFGDICEELRNLKFSNLITYWVGNKSLLSREDLAAMPELAANLSSPVAEVQRSAASAIRLLSEKTDDHRISIAEQGVIPLLVALILSPDEKTQEHVVRSLLNLSLVDSNKGQIISAGAIESSIQALRSDCMVVRDEAVELLFILSPIGANKISIGSSGSTPALVQDGTAQGKNDAATALFKLPTYQGNGKPNVPDGFKCPISLDLMRDPVMIATGQTYERSCIQKWLDSGKRTCPKTAFLLPHANLTPNDVLQSVIAEWCTLHSIELPKKLVKGSQCFPEDKAAIDELIAKLSSPMAEVQRSAAYDIRLRAKKNVDHRICIAEQGAIPLLVVLLLSPDQKTQEHAVTTLLNLSFNDSNKGRIVAAGAIEPVVEVLRSGCMEARKNAAATLFSLSLVDENKITIGNSGAIPALVQLLHDGTARGKRDAASALFNLSTYQGNKARAIQAGVVPPLMSLIAEQPATMLDEALAILAILATHHEGRIAIGEVGPTPIWERIIVSESPRSKENAAAILLALCSHDPGYLKQARESNAIEPLTVWVRSRDSKYRTKRKASALLELLKKPEVKAVSHGVEVLQI